MQDWKDAEDIVKDHFVNQGYTVLNQNDKGFPDLIVLKDGEVSFFVEVKAMQNPDIEIYEMRYHQYLNKLGYAVRCVNVRNQKLEFFEPDAEWEKAVRETNLLLSKKR